MGNKVGVLTFHNTANYGAALQACALVESIVALGWEAELIDYRCPTITEKEKPLPNLVHMFAHPRGALISLKNYSDNIRRRKGFETFCREAAPVGPRVYSEKEIASNYDVAVVGSDQVWNPLCTGGDLTYFLGTSSSSAVEKIAYAASFGKESIPEEYHDYCGRAIKNFRSVGVREESGVTLARELSGRDACHVLDPTLLLNKEEWGKRAVKRIDGRYVFAYVVSERQETIRCATEIAKSTDSQLVICECYGAVKDVSGAIYCNDATPGEFVGLISDAVAVVTSSFHGLAMSIALEKDFYYGLKPGGENLNTRLESLAKLAGVEGRNISLPSPTKSVDYEAIRANINEAKKASLSFLKNALESGSNGQQK